MRIPHLLPFLVVAWSIDCFGNDPLALKPIIADTIALSPESGILTDSEDVGSDPFALLLDTVFVKEPSIRTAYATFTKLLPVAKEKRMTGALFTSLYTYNKKQRLSQDLVNYGWYCVTWRNAAMAAPDDFLKRCYSDCFYEELVNGTFATPVIDTGAWESTDSIKAGLYLRDTSCVIPYHYELSRLVWNPGYANAKYAVVRKQSAEASWRAWFTPVRISEPGYYRLIVYTDDNYRVFYFARSSMVRAIAYSDNRSLFIKCFSGDSNVSKPYTVTLLSNDTIVQKKSDAAGVCAVTFKKHAKDTLRVDAFVECNGTIAPLHIAQPVLDQRNKACAYLYTDRSWYRPGDTVHIGGMVKNYTDAVDFTRSGLDTVECTITASHSQKSTTTTVSVDAMGHFFDSLPIPAEAALETYSVAVAPRRSFTGMFPCSLATKFDVATFNKPSCIVQCSANKQAFAPGESIAVKINARYLLGTPVKYAAVHLFARYEGYALDTLLRPGTSPRYSYRPAIEKENPKVLFTNKTLDGAGAYTFAFTPDTTFTTGWFTLFAQVDGHDKRTYQGSCRVFVAADTPIVSCFTKAVPVNDSAVVAVACFVTDHLGMPVTATVNCRLFDDAGNQIGAEVRSTGSGVIRFAFKDMARSGWQAAITVNPGSTRQQQRRLAITASSYLDRSGDGTLHIECDRNTYKHGDTALIRVYWPSYTTSKMVFTGNVVLQKYLDVKEDEASTFRVPITPQCGAVLFFTASCYDTMSSEVLQQHEQLVLEPDSSLLLRVTSSSLQKHAPGDLCTLTYAFTDRDRMPAKASFSAAVVDEAVFAIAPEHDTGVLEGLVPRSYQYPCSTFASEMVDMNDQLNYIEMLGNKTCIVNNLPQRASSHFRFGYGQDDVCTDHREGFGSWLLQQLSGIGFSGVGCGECGGDSFDGSGSGGIDDLIGGLMGGDGGEGLDMKQKGLRWSGTPGVDAPPEPLRSNFTDQAFWASRIWSNSNGIARFTFRLPDNLTQWRIHLRGSDGKRYLLDHRDSCIVQKPLMLHLETPRFVVVNDNATAFTVLFNTIDSLLPVRITCKAERGAKIDGRTVVDTSIAPNGIITVNWPLIISNADSAIVTASVTSALDADGERRSIPVKPYALRMRSGASVMVNDTASVRIQLPPEVMARQKRLTLQVAGDEITALLPTLRYLMDFPHGCVEQTMNRFLPDLYVARLLKEHGMRNDSLEKRFSKASREGVALLKGYQHDDGGWGWWKDDATSPLMTALVVKGLYYAASVQLDKETGRTVLAMLDRGVFRVMRYLDSVKANDAERLLLLESITASPHLKEEGAIIDTLLSRMLRLSTQECAQLLACVHALGRSVDETTLVSELERRAHLNGEYVTWNEQTTQESPDDWQSSEVHCTAVVLGAIATVNPQHPMIAKTLQWLYTKNDGEKWITTATTAEVVRAIGICNSQKPTGKHRSVDLQIKVNGVALPAMVAGEYGVAGGYSIPDSLVNLTNEISIANCSGAPRYVNARLDYFGHAGYIDTERLPLTVGRTYYRIDITTTAATKRFPIDQACGSGDEIEGVLTIKTALPRGYLCIEEPLPAGVEIIIPEKSALPKFCTHAEYYPDRIVFYCKEIPAGTTNIAYRMRAQFPGEYRILPTSVQSMYIHEIKGYSSGSVLRIRGEQ